MDDRSTVDGCFRIRGTVDTDGIGMENLEVVESSVTQMHALAERLKILRRLLDRAEEEGSAIGVEPAIVRAVIEAGREEMRSIRVILTRILTDPANPWIHATDDTIKLTAGVDDLLNILEGSVRLLES